MIKCNFPTLLRFLGYRRTLHNKMNVVKMNMYSAIRGPFPTLIGSLKIWIAHPFKMAATRQGKNIPIAKKTGLRSLRHEFTKMGL